MKHLMRTSFCVSVILTSTTISAKSPDQVFYCKGIEDGGSYNLYAKSGSVPIHSLVNLAYGNLREESYTKEIFLGEINQGLIGKTHCVAFRYIQDSSHPGRWFWSCTPLLDKQIRILVSKGYRFGRDECQ